MNEPTIELDLEDEAATNRFGEGLALALRPGDLVRLSGELGAGKSTLARAVIRTACRNHALEVPSPTFTLVQTYAGAQPQGSISHYDLYRLEDPVELEELGLAEALDEGAVLVEWPENGGRELRDGDLNILLQTTGQNTRKAVISGSPAAIERLKRSFAIRRFLNRTWHNTVQRYYLLGDASTRAYEVASIGSECRILMNAPRAPDGPVIKDGKPYSQIAHLAEDVRPFVAIAAILRENGFRAPLIHAEDLDEGLLLIEDLGDQSIIDAKRNPIATRYMACVEVLAAIHQCKWQKTIALDEGSVVTIPDFDRSAMMIEVDLLLQWYVPTTIGSSLTGIQNDRYRAIWSELIDALENSEKSLVLRDYHSPNLLWQQGNSGTDRIGLIDFQDALIGPAAYDLASLAQDARVSVSPELENQLLETYVTARQRTDPGFDEAGFKQDYMIMTAQRGMKLLGLFIRLNERDGKPSYLAHIPRLKTYLQRSLEHPALAGLKSWLNDNVDF